MPYFRKNGNINPCTGEPLSQKDLVKLTIHKNEKQQNHCPVTFKVFNENSHIVAVMETGNVYSYEAYKELNKEPQWWHDLMTEEKFDPQNLITLQDPKRPPRKFDYRQVKDPELINPSGQQKRTMDLINQQKSELLEQHRKLGDSLQKR